MNSTGDGEGPRRRPLAPLLRWAGGKRWLSPAIHEVAQHFPPTAYLEPFVGGGAVFFSRNWTAPVIGDSNEALTMCYRGIADDPAEVRRLLGRWEMDSKTFQEVARSKPRKSTTCAARLLYLNRAAYGGIYRENAKGEFNVPFSGDRTMDSILSGSRLEEVSQALAGAAIVTGDFEATMAYARPGALVFCDPPYSLPGGETSFRRYGHRPFAWSDQRRLAAACRRLAESGCTVIVSNSDHEVVRELYSPADALTVSRSTTLDKGRVVEQKEAIYVMHDNAGIAEEIANLLQGVLP